MSVKHKYRWLTTHAPLLNSVNHHPNQTPISPTPAYQLLVYKTQCSFTPYHTNKKPTHTNITKKIKKIADERAGAEIVYGAEECLRHSIELLDELGFPRGVLPLKDLVECGRVRATDFVWMKQKAPYEHFFEGTNTRVSYAIEVTAYIEKCKMKKMTGVKSKQLLMWVPIVEMSMEDINSSKIYFKIPVGVGKSFPVTAFMTEEEKKKYIERSK